MEESDELNGVVFVRLRQVDLLQHKDLTAAVERLKDFAISRGGFETSLIQLLDDQISLGLSVTMKCDYLALLAFL